MFSLFDCHCDTITRAMEFNQCLRKNSLHIDFERLNNLDRAAQLFAIWLDEPYLNRAFDNTCLAIDFFKNEIQKNSDLICLCTSAKELALENGKIKGILTVEGGEAVEGSSEKLNYLYKEGVRLMTLTWNGSNAIGHGALSGCTDGLTDFGLACIRQMNELSMLIDVSHLNERGFWDVYKNSEKPFIASHSNAHFLCAHPRNLTDKQLAAMAERECAVGVNIFPPFLSEYEASIDTILRHIDYLARRVGENMVGMGCDFDGIDSMPRGISGVQDLYRVYEACVKSFGIDFSNNIFYNNMYNFICNAL